MGLQEIWKKRNPECLPGGINDFAKFLGSEESILQEINYTQLIKLLILEGKITEGDIFTERASDLFIYQWQCGERTVEGRGKTFLDAALEGLINCWVLSATQKEALNVEINQNRQT